jgi:spermidine synthase
MGPPATTRRFLLAAFFLSGAAALVFEVVWTRLLLLEFGATSLAVAAVLAAFMGGMALGSAIAPWLLRRVRDPLLVYGLLEAWLGLFGLLTPALLGSIADGPLAARFAVSLLALLPATAAMGASLPVLAGAVAPGERSAGSLVGRLYALNTAGAVAGPLLAAFLLFPVLGLARALHAAAFADIAVGVAVLALRRRLGAQVAAPPPAGPRRSQVPIPPARTRPSAPLLIALAISGASSMAYEVAWARTLSLVFGSSVYGVSIMLSTFLIGLASGSALAASALRSRSPRVPVHACAWLLAGSGAAAFLSLFVAKGLPLAFLQLHGSLPEGDLALFLSQLAVAAALMAPATLCLGAMLPVAVAAGDGESGGVAARVAGLYTANLAGATLGTLLAAGLMIGSFGIELTVRLAAAAALLAAAWLFLRPLKVEGALPAFAAAVFALAIEPAWEPVSRSFGLYTDPAGYARFDFATLGRLVGAHRILYERDGPTATVAVQEVEDYRILKINGKTDASNGPGDTRTQLLLGHLPLLAADARRVAVVGWGSGVTVGAVLTHAVESVDAFEIEPAVVEASRHFEPENGKPLEDPRVRLVLGDARTELERRGPYDLIISEPSNPWITGVANLFTADFFALAASRLAPEGILCQWFHLYGMSEAATRSLLSTFRSVFPHTLAFGGRDLLLVGSRRPTRFDVARMAKLFEKPEVRASLERIQVRYPFDLLIDLQLDERGAAAFAGGAPLNTDDNMLLELSAPRSLHRDRSAEILAAMARHGVEPERSLSGYANRADLELERAASLFTRGRHQEALAACRQALALQTSFEGKKLQGQILQQLGRGEEARLALREALALPADAGARAFVEALLRSLGAAPGGA